MRYAHGGGLTPREQEKRERVRLQAAERFARGEKSEAVARYLRVTARSVRRWRRAWEQGGADALRSAGPASLERLSRVQWEQLEREWRSWQTSPRSTRTRYAYSRCHPTPAS
ncbi:helix-turn-helix domain-containing protein [Streptomyces sp. IMTB 2501]|uniref:helix-turn-helix domain-containing protein n=1 Tax=Streptomyces sp. IMTB 2501 TaxID=1776340 RepID=UPI0011812DA1|nr:helix-turn-helix domain-containing protein [Streptomyces sp. IMTB 2501]